MAISVNMLKLRVFSDIQPRSKNGRPHHSTTGVASINCAHCIVFIDRPRGSNEGARSAVIASTKTGNASARPIQKRRLISINSWFLSSTAILRDSSAMPHLGQLPGWSCTTSGCIGQVYSIRVDGSGAPAGSSAMPQIGQLPGWSCSISGSIGQMYSAPATGASNAAFF